MIACSYTFSEMTAKDRTGFQLSIIRSNIPDFLS